MNQPSPRLAPCTGWFYDAERRHEMIAQAAYFRAKHRDFEPGHELEDWLAAETEVDAALSVAPGR